MANWYGAARSNYFRVTDLDAFTADVERLCGGLEISPALDSGSAPKGSICLIDGDGEGWPSICQGFEDDGEGVCANCCVVHKDDDPESLDELVSKYLVDGDVAIFIETGAEKRRYLSGLAVAVNNAGERVVIDLNDIYSEAAKLGTTITRAEY